MDMAYRIVYGPEKRITKKKGKKGVLLAALLLALVLTGRFLGWGEYLIPGDATVTTLAFEQMVSSLADGAPAQEAFADFCREIIAHGQIY